MNIRLDPRQRFYLVVAHRQGVDVGVPSYGSYLRPRHARGRSLRRLGLQRWRALVATVTWNSQVDSFPEASVAVQVTTVVPRGKKLPEGGTHTTPGAGSRQSLAGTEKVTISPGALPSSSSTSTGEGQESVGGSRSGGLPHLAR